MWSFRFPLFCQIRLEQALEQLKKRFDGGKYASIKRHCVLGDPGSEIAKLATDIQANLIVIPSHGRTGFKRILLGSVAERVLRLSACPVLVLRDGI